MMETDHFKFRLYVVGNGPNSKAAIVNLDLLCRRYLPGRHEIEVIDLLHAPEHAVTDNVMLTPLLVRVSPAPTCSIVGNLSHIEPLLQIMGFPV